MQDTQRTSSLRSVAVEDLLRLKRMEKPGEEFWASFEQELRQRRLKELVRPAAHARLLSPTWCRAVAGAFLSVAAVWTFSLVTIAYYSGIGDEHAAAPANVVIAEENYTTSPYPAVADSDDAALDVVASQPRVLEPHFVSNRLVPDARLYEHLPFRMARIDKSWVAVSRPGAEYVVNSFTSGGGFRDPAITF